MIEAIIVVAKAQLKIAEEKLKKSKRKLKDEEEGKKSPKDIVEHKKEENKDPEKKEKEVKKKKIKVNAEFVKVQALRVKILVLQVIKYIVMIIEQFVMFLIATFGALGLFIVLVVLVLMIAIYGFLHIDMTVPNGEILNSSGNQYENNCIQGGQVINSDTANLDLSTLEGALTGYQKDVLNVFQLYDEFIKGEGSIQPITKGFNADVVYRVYRGIPLSSSKQYSLFGKSNVDNKIKENSLSYDLSNSAEGTTLSSYTVVDSSYIDSWKSKYSLPISDSELYWAPYSVAISVLDKMQISESIGTSGSNESAFKTYVESQMTSLGIVENANECYQYIQAFVAISASEYGVDYLNVDANTYGIKEQISYLCMLFANSSDSDSNRHFYNYKIDTTQTLEYKEDIIWDSLMGSNSVESADLSSLSLSDKYLKVNNENIDKPIISLLYDKFAENADVNGFFTKIVGDSNSLNLLQSYSRGFTYLVVSDYMANILAKSAPLVVGTGSPYDCDCYTSGEYTIFGEKSYLEGIDVQTLENFKKRLAETRGPGSFKNDINSHYNNIARPTKDVDISVFLPTTENPIKGLSKDNEEWVLKYVEYADMSRYVLEGSKNASAYQLMLPYAMSTDNYYPCNSDGLCYYKGRYIVAVALPFGFNGDIIDVYFDNGVILPCVVGEAKGTGDSNSVFIDGVFAGHVQASFKTGTSVWDAYCPVEFIKEPSKVSGIYSLIRDKYKWVVGSDSRTASVVKIVNHGNVFEDISLVDKYFSEDGNLSYSNISTSSNVDCIGSNGFVETPGQFQGPWKNIPEIIENLTDIDNSRKEVLKSIIPYVGTKPINIDRPEFKYKQDKWKDKNTLGCVRYGQAWAIGSIKNEDYSSIKYSLCTTVEGHVHSACSGTFRSSSCGCFSASMVASTLLGKYLNPAELMLAGMTYIDRHSELNSFDAGFYMLRDGRNCIFNREIQKAILTELGLSVELGSLTQDKVDSCLEKNGMIILCVQGKGNKGLWFTSSEGSHYIVIREKVNDKYLIYSSTNWSNNVDGRGKAADYLFTWQDIYSMDSGASVNYVVK